MGVWGEMVNKNDSEKSGGYAKKTSCEGKSFKRYY